MANDFKSFEKESKDLHSFLSQSLFSSKFKNYFYGVFCQLFKLKYSRKTKTNIQLGYEILINATFTLQLISLAWYPKMKVHGWSSYKRFWNIIGWTSYDSICANLGIMNFCFFGTISLIGMCLISFSVFGFYIYIKKDPPIYISIFPKKIATLLTTVCLIPSTMILLMIAKYSILDVQEIEEYDGLSSDILDFGTMGIFLSIFFLLILIPINVISEYFSCDIQHSHSEKNLKSRSCSLLDLQKRVYYTITCILFVAFGDSHVIVHQAILLSFAVFLGYKSITVLHYFNILENVVEACKMGSISTMILVFIFGEILNDALIIVVFTICLQPIVFLLMTRIVKRNYMKLKDNTSYPNNQFEFERKFRHLLVDKAYEDKILVLDLFKTYWKANKFQKDKLFVIWEFSYCLTIVKNERLARVKLSKIANAKASFEGEIQEWRLFNWLVKRKCKSFPETNYLEFLKEYSRIRNQDEELCYALIELQIEMALKAPRIHKIVKLANKAASHIINLSEDFKNLCDKYKNLEGYELYGGFLENITNDHDEAGVVNRKKNGINFYNQHNDIKKLENYGKDVPTILVSCTDDDSFCRVMYLNEKASRLLKSPIGNIIGTSILNFIPQPFDACHSQNIKNFVFNTSTIDLPSHKYLFFQNTEGHLVECNFLIKLTAFHNCAYFLISFEQRKTSREIALISDDGFIIGHSELFPFYIGSESKSVKGQSLSSVVPVLEISKMQGYEPWILPFNDGELAFIHKIRQINSISIHELIIIHDEREIKNWKEGIDQDQLLHFADQDITIDYDQTLSDLDIKRKGVQIRYHSISNFSLSAKSYDKVETEYLTNDNVHTKELLNSCRSQDKKSLTEDHSKSSAGCLLPNQAKRILVESKRKIRVLQVVLFLVMSSVIVTVGAILGYMITDVSYTTSLSSFKNLGQLLYDLGVSADVTRILDKLSILEDSTSEQLQSTINDLTNLITDLEAVQGTIFDDFNQWSYCSSSEIVTSAIIPIISFEELEPKVKYSNLYDAVSEIILNCKSMIKAVLQKEPYLSHVRFIFANGVGNLYDQTNSTMNGIVNCEIERVKNTGENINILLICGFCTLGILVLVIIGYIILVSQKIDEFWNFILNNAQWALAKLKSSASDRLVLIHGIEYNSELTIDISGSRLKRKVRTSIYLQYIWRLMIFFAIAASYYLLIFCYLYPNCETLMVNRPKLLSNFNMRRSNLRRLSMFTRETYAHYIAFRLPKYFEFSNPWTMVNRTSNLIKLKNKELRQDDIKKLMSGELKSRIYESVEPSGEVLEYGTEAAINSIIDDCENQGYYDFIPTSQIFALLANVGLIQNEISQEFVLADRDSKNLINDQLKSIIYTTAAYSVAVCVLFFCYYLPYLNNQVKQLNRFSILPKILPMEPE